MRVVGVRQTVIFTDDGGELTNSLMLEMAGNIVFIPVDADSAKDVINNFYASGSTDIPAGAVAQQVVTQQPLEEGLDADLVDFIGEAEI